MSWWPWSKQAPQGPAQQIAYDEIVQIFKAAGKSVPVDYTGAEEWTTVTLDDINSTTNQRLKALKYGANGVDCGWMQTVWYSAFAGEQKAVGICLGHVTGRYQDNHYFGWFIDNEKTLRFYDPVEQWELPEDIVKGIIRARIN